MILSVEDLEKLFKSDDYNTLPLQMVLESGRQDAWRHTTDHLLGIATRQLIWEAAQCVALMFDTYQEQVNRVELVFEKSVDGIMTSKVFTNEAWCFPKHHPTFSELRDVDQLQSLELLLDRVEGMTSDYLLTSLPTLQKSFNVVFKSAEQARTTGRQHAPVIDAWVRKHLLEQRIPTERHPLTARAKPKAM